MGPVLFSATGNGWRLASSHKIHYGKWKGIICVGNEREREWKKTYGKLHGRLNHCDSIHSYIVTPILKANWYFFTRTQKNISNTNWLTIFCSDQHLNKSLLLANQFLCTFNSIFSIPIHTGINELNLKCLVICTYNNKPNSCVKIFRTFVFIQQARRHTWHVWFAPHETYHFNASLYTHTCFVRSSLYTLFV